MSGDIVESNLKAMHIEPNAAKEPKQQNLDCVSSKPLPAYIQHRINLWDKWSAEYTVWLAKQNRVPIIVKLLGQFVTDSSTPYTATAWETSPWTIVRDRMKQDLWGSIVISRVNGILWDLERPLEQDATEVEFLDFNHPDGQYVFWHSSAHILGEAMEKEYHGHLCYGPPVDEGFYYDMFMTNERSVKPEDYKVLDDACKKVIKEKQKFERLLLTKAQLHEMFGYNVFKGRILDEKVQEAMTTAYRCGPLIDLCIGPHIRHTGLVGAMAVIKNSSSYWMGQSNEETLQRVYGISFPESKQLKEWKQIQEEAAKRDHRKIGLEQELFYFDELSPGAAFFYPKGKHIRNELEKLIREEYWKRRYTEVETPNKFNIELWKTSGHWDHYKENMFLTEIEKTTFADKPMNCPGHCRLFLSKARSYRELPLRLAEFGVLHRNEVSGALAGLTRVRRFVQDDAHIFCRHDQLKAEISDCLQFVKSLYDLFGFKFDTNLSTRPESFMGAIEIWNRAEAELMASLTENGFEYKLNPGDGAFYGPKIDFRIQDALKRYHQCATIQLDFQLPERFNLTYQHPHNPLNNTDTSSSRPNDSNVNVSLERPVIVHRAMLGSIERFIAILTEHCAGKWPFWLSPRQILIVSVMSSVEDYGVIIEQKLHDAGFMVELDFDPGHTLNKKIRNGQIAQFNFILVIGAKEKEAGSVSVRARDNTDYGAQSLEKVIEVFTHLKKNRIRDDEMGEVFPKSS